MALSWNLPALFFAEGLPYSPIPHQYDIKATDKVVDIGIGGLGHLALQYLNTWGCEATAFTSSKAIKEETLQLGAHHTLNSRDEDALTATAGSFDFIISTVNVKLDWTFYLAALKPKGCLHFVEATLDSLDLNVFQLIILETAAGLA